MKESYIPVEARIILFETEDIITDSDETRMLDPNNDADTPG